MESTPEALRALAEVITTHRDELARQACASIRGLEPSFEAVDSGELERVARRNLDLLARAIGEGRPPTSDETLEATRGVADRARAGIPREPFARSYSAVLRSVWETVRARATNAGVPEAALHRGLELMWAWSDTISERAMELHRSIELEQARHDARARSEFLHGLLFASSPASTLRARAAMYGLRPDSAYVAVRAVPADGVAWSELERALQTEAASPGLLGLVDGHLAGVLPQVPHVAVSLGTAGVGPPTHLLDAERSFALASRLLQAARRFRRGGTATLGQISLRLAVSEFEEIGAHVDARHLAPLDSAGHFGAVLATTIDTYLAEGMRTDRTAARLHIHENTLRKRLRRFEELTGTDLGRVDRLFEVWWALRRREMSAPDS